MFEWKPKLNNKQNIFVGGICETNQDGNVEVLSLDRVDGKYFAVIKFIGSENVYTVGRQALKEGKVKDNRKDRTKEFIEQCSQVHNNFYDYSKTIYKDSEKKIVVICPIHGEFSVQAGSHKSGTECRKCAIEKHSKAQSLTTEEFVQKSKEKFGNRYDYSKTLYVNAKTKVIIICPVHGEFSIVACEHLDTTNGCPSCGKEIRAENYKTTFQDFVKQSKDIHGDKYIYHEDTFNGMKNRTTITCPEHGSWSTIAAHHTSNQAGCAKCAGIVKKTTDEFIADAVNVHGDIYDYSLVEYVNNREKVSIICKEHGVFKQVPSSHLQGTGCPSCTHGGFDPSVESYLYILSDPINNITKVGITNNKVSARVSQINRTTANKFCEMVSYKLMGSVCQDIEEYTLSQLKLCGFKQPTEKFDGYTECFFNVNWKAVAQMIQEQLEDVEA